jgi:hypothetical protein
MEEENVQAAPGAAEKPVEKPRRKRRTKAQIEADNAAKAQAEQHSEDVEPKKECPVETLEIDKDRIMSSVTAESTSDAADSDVEHSSESENTVQESSVASNGSFKGTLLVHEAPYDGSYVKKLYGVFTPICEVNGFVQVEYVKHGFGTVRGYVKPKQK